MTSRLVFKKAGYYGITKLTHKINYHTQMCYGVGPTRQAPGSLAVTFLSGCLSLCNLMSTGSSPS